jgi:conjugal transfer pilin signal peptidase TrbI
MSALASSQERTFRDYQNLFSMLVLLLGSYGAIQWVASEIGRDWVVHPNMSDSLPHLAYAVHKGQTVARGDYVGFVQHASGLFPEKVMFVKEVAGTPGDIVMMSGGRAYLNGRDMGAVLPVSRSGVALVPGPEGPVPEGCVWVYSPHPRSFDSRYAAVGFVCGRDIVGRAIPLL